MRAELCHRSQ